MREILFRGKRIDNGAWVEGFCLTDNDLLPGTYICQKLTVTCKEKCEMLMGGFVSVDPATVGQYTGLTDKNGVRIFEGDIVRTNKYGKDDGAGHNSAGNDIFCVEFRDGGYHLFNGWRRFNLRPDTVVEIIGNIHDNPELREEAPHA